MSSNRSAYTAGHFLFHLDGDKETSWLKSVDGGGVKGSVIEEDVGPDFLQLKHVATVEIDPLSLEVGLSASAPIFRWIQDSWKRKFSRRNGSIIHANFNLESVIEQWFRDALISEVSFPTLDGSDSNPAYLGIKLLPEFIETKPGDQRHIQGVEGHKQKMWTPSSFRLEIDGIDCRRVNKIDGFTVKQSIKPLYVGSNRFPELEPTGVEFPSLKLSMAAAYADEFIKWHHDFVVKGDKDPKHQKTGAIEFLDPATDKTIFSITLDHVGINHLSIDKSEANSEAIKRCTVELFVETMELDLGSSGLD
ncbi:phage tail protein [Haliangium sp.]|uniref:phage tail protein n=1 Tax=Haliangium sp. TaxID=2663208 RepID=UPI003D0C1077